MIRPTRSNGVRFSSQTNTVEQTLSTKKISQIIGQTGSNHESNSVDRVEQARIMSRTRSNHESNRVESWVEQG